MKTTKFVLALIVTMFCTACTAVPQITPSPSVTATPQATSSQEVSTSPSDSDAPLCASCTSQDSSNCDSNEVCAINFGNPTGVCVPEPSPGKKLRNEDINAMCHTNYREQGE